MRANHDECQCAVHGNRELQVDLESMAAPAFTDFVVWDDINITRKPLPITALAPLGMFEIMRFPSAVGKKTGDAVEQILHRPSEILQISFTLTSRQPNIICVDSSASDHFLQSSQVNQRCLAANPSPVPGRLRQGRPIDQPQRGHLTYHHDKLFAPIL